jgi:hypothetical protein
VILQHDWPRLHWDLLLEADSILRAWRLLEEPLPGRTVQSEANAPHRLEYLDYEGPVSGGRGTVRRWDWGTFEWISDEPGQSTILLHGTKLRGNCTLDESACRLP